MRQFLLILMPFLLAACDPMSNAVMGATTIASYSLTGKSPFDNAMSRAADKDCDLTKMDKRDGEYCVANKLKADPYFAAVGNPSVYCFRTMGEVECHCNADPFSNSNTPFVRGRGDQSPAAMCGGRNMAAISEIQVMSQSTYVPSRAKQGEPLAPPELPPEAYKDILAPASRPMRDSAPPKQPLTLAPENYGS